VLLSALIHHAHWFSVLTDIVHPSNTSKRVLSRTFTNHHVSDATLWMGRMLTY
jgi:hypothetical protein